MVFVYIHRGGLVAIIFVQGVNDENHAVLARGLQLRSAASVFTVNQDLSSWSSAQPDSTLTVPSPVVTARLPAFAPQAAATPPTAFLKTSDHALELFA